MRARRNLYLYLPYQISSQEGLAHGIYLVWMLSAKGLSPQVATLILAAGEIATVVLQVPTGILADRFGRRGSLIAGSVTQVLGLMGFWFGVGPFQLLAGAALIAVGDSFRSGADEALLYESCASIGRADAFGRLVAAARAGSTLGMAALVALGGHLSCIYGMGAAWAGETALCTAGLVIALCMAPTDSAALIPGDEAGEALDLRLPTLSVMAHVILPAAICGALVASGELFTQLDWPSQPGIEQLTWVIAAAIIFEALGSLIATRSSSPDTTWVLGGLAIAIGGAWGGAPALAFFALSLIDGWIKPVRADQIQREAADEHRAQAASWAGALDTGISVLLLPIAAALHARFDSSGAEAMLAAILGLLWAAFRWRAS